MGTYKNNGFGSQWLRSEITHVAGWQVHCPLFEVQAAAPWVEISHLRRCEAFEDIGDTVILTCRPAWRKWMAKVYDIEDETTEVGLGTIPRTFRTEWPWKGFIVHIPYHIGAIVGDGKWSHFRVRLVPTRTRNDLPWDSCCHVNHNMGTRLTVWT